MNMTPSSTDRKPMVLAYVALEVDSVIRAIESELPNDPDLRQTLGLARRCRLDALDLWAAETRCNFSTIGETLDAVREWFTTNYSAAAEAWLLDYRLHGFLE